MKSLYLSNRVALVTGASKGIGRAIALDLARAGAAVAVTARSNDLLKTLQAEIEAHGGICIVDCFDIRQADRLELFIAKVQQELHSLDILVNNAGVYTTAALKDQNLQAWQETIDTNLTAAMRASKAVVAAMLDQKWGRIINVSSVSGKTGEAYGSAYSASKFAMIGITQSLALEVAPHGITVNAVCPGWVNTEMAHRQLHDEQWCKLNNIEIEESLAIAKLSVPQERLIEPDEVASLVTYLCGEPARGITGQAINICGGLSLH